MCKYLLPFSSTNLLLKKHIFSTIKHNIFIITVTNSVWIVGFNELLRESVDVYHRIQKKITALLCKCIAHMSDAATNVYTATYANAGLSLCAVHVFKTSHRLYLITCFT